jgi:hypothetical protein
MNLFLRAILSTTLLGWALALPFGVAMASEPLPDVVVYGATPAGIATAIAVARAGGTAIIVEPSKWIGGMVTGGLSHTDFGSAPQVIGGISREFFERADACYQDPRKTARNDFWYSEPHIAMETFKAMLAEAKVEVITNTHLSGVEKMNAKITRMMMSDGTNFSGKVFVDATYEGDLMAKAGVSYIVGRESRDTYGESFAGFQQPEIRPQTVEFMAKPGTAYVHGTPAKLSALGDDGKPLPVVNGQWLKPGEGDARSQSYNFRVIVTDRPDNRVPFPKPAHYDPLRYEILRRLIAAFPGIRYEKLVFLGSLPNHKCDANASGLVQGTDHVGANAEYPEGDAKTRVRIWQDHVDYVQGFFWFLANDPRLPEELREEANRWGLARDEFTDNGHWPYALYVREARRMLGETVMTQSDCSTNRHKPDGIGMGSFILDSHAVQRLSTPDGDVLDEGNFDIGVKPYEIPYRCLTPKAAQCENLLVPVCLSASHVAYGSIRMEPQFMIMGQVSGLAAMMSIKAGKAVQAIDVPALQKNLVELHCVIALAAGPSELTSTSLPGVAVDDENATFTGAWQMSSSPKAVDGSYQHDLNANKGLKTARYTMKVPADGRYEVRFSYVPFANRASNIPVAIEHASGTTNVKVNERVEPPINKTFVSLGTYEFLARKPAVVTVKNEDTDGYVAVDTVQLLPSH